MGATQKATMQKIRSCLAEVFHQAHDQDNAPGQVVEFDVFVGVVDQAAASTQTIEGGCAGPGGGVGVRGYTATDILDIDAEFSARCFHLGDERFVLGVALEGLAAHATAENHAGAVENVLRGDIAHGFLDRANPRLAGGADMQKPPGYAFSSGKWIMMSCATAEREKKSCTNI